ncbi:MAG: flagellar biosynthesis anti-sigma factor FlgM, partial [Pyrinomonadaceae bacterium]|nr:flagellar biosynthesis anti-sigma factor FlgM [Pyrinomonadaceae bacterium]
AMNSINFNPHAGMAQRARINRLVSIVKALPNVRPDKVAALRAQLQASQYPPAATEIADAIIKAEK